jgi:hypothetical protein
MVFAHVSSYATIIAAQEAHVSGPKYDLGEYSSEREYL